MRFEMTSGWLNSVRQRLDSIEIQDPAIARFICKLIPTSCPFERDIKLFGYQLIRIPPLCKFNPLYEQIVAIRFKALTYLVERCGENIAAYC
jgi:hypothetical protein